MPILYLILFLQVCAVCTVNLFFLDHFLGFDSSATYLQVMEIWKQQTFFIENWNYTTTLTWDTPLLFAVPLYGLLGDVFLAYGIAILLCILLFLWTSYEMLTLMDASHTAKIIFAICFLTPFVSYEDSYNRIDYFAVMLSLLGVYILKTAMTLLLWVVFLRLDKPILHNNQILHTEKTVILAGFSLAFCFFTGISSGLHVFLFGIVPPLIYVILRNVFLDSWDKSSMQALVFLLASALLSVFGKTLGASFIGYSSMENSFGWTSVTNFWENLQSIFEGYLQLTGALPLATSPSAFSLESIAHGFLLALSMGILISGIYTMVRHIKEDDDSVAQYFTQIFVMILLIFVFVYTKYGATFFEVRYLIPNFIILLMFASIWLDEQLHSDNFSISVFLQCTVFPALVAVNLISYHYLYNSRINRDLIEDLTQYLSSHETPVVYILGLDSMILGRNIRVYDHDKVYLWAKTLDHYSSWGDYTYYNETSEYEGPTALIASEAYYSKLPNHLQEKYTKTRSFDDGIAVYHAKTNPLDFLSGITHLPYSKDFFYSPNIQVSSRGLYNDEGEYHILGDGSYASWGPNLPIPDGVYDFTLHYEVISETLPTIIGYFDITSDVGVNDRVVAKIPLNPHSDSVTLENINFSAIIGEKYDYRVQIEYGVEIVLKYVEIQRKDV